MLHTEPKVMVEKRPDVQLAVADDAQADDLIRAVGDPPRAVNVPHPQPDDPRAPQPIRPPLSAFTDPLSDDASSPGQSGRRKQARSPVTSVCSQRASRRHM
jgi:hypothetical protein